MLNWKTTIGLMILVVLLAILPLLLTQNAEFAGADGLAEEAITEIHPTYEPWFTPIFEPPSGEIESLIFALQAAIGTGVIAYYFGYKSGIRKAKEKI